MIVKKDRVAKARWADEKAITAWGGLALAERLAHRTRLWSDCRRLIPARTRTGAGYDSTTVASAMIHGLLSGSRGTYAAEPLRDDEGLRRLVGLEQGVPEEATVWRALGQWAGGRGARAFGRLQRSQCRRLIQSTPMTAMRDRGFGAEHGGGRAPDRVGARGGLDAAVAPATRIVRHPGPSRTPRAPNASPTLFDQQSTSNHLLGGYGPPRRMLN